MMNRTRLFAALAVLLAAPALGAQQQYGRDSDTWKWDGRVDAGHWMNVFNINGSVDFAPSPDNMVHLVAVKRSNGREMDDIHYEVVQAGGNVTICAIWNNNSRCEDGGVESIHRNGNNETHSNVKITVSVPRSVKVGAHSVNGGVSVRDVGAEVRANTVNGGVVVRNTSGPVRATTVNGGVDVNTAAGPVTAETVNGNVDARMASLQGDDDMNFKTVNGSVSIYVPASFDATFRFETVHGGIESDFPMTLSGRWGPRHASGTIGNGGRDVRASSVNGSIELRKQ
jgi:carbon monoxide dehydrogenase subunit G